MRTILLLAFLLLPIFYFSQQDANGWYLANTGVDGTKNYIKNLEKKVKIVLHVGLKWFLRRKKTRRE